MLRTNGTDWTPESLWQTYVQLTEAEAAFRIQKRELGLRPIWHQKAERVEAHIKRLGLELPERLRIPPRIAKM